jgi:hypothetical protein
MRSSARFLYTTDLDACDLVISTEGKDGSDVEGHDPGNLAVLRVASV